MLPSFLLALREGLEVALVLGIVLGGLRRLRRSDCAHVVWAGIASAGILSAAIGVLLRAWGWTFDESTEPIFEGFMLLSAAGLLTWMIFWMNRQARTLRASVEAELSNAVCASGRRGVFMLTFVAVLREGVELAVFLTAAHTDAKVSQVVAGAALGLVAAAVIGSCVFATSIRLPLRWIFRVTNIALILFAAGLVAKAVHEFEEVGWISPLVAPVWNTSAVINEASVPGSVLKSLVGYTSTPSLAVALAYLIYLATTALVLPAAFKRAEVPVGRSAR